MGQSLEVVTSELRSASATLADASQRLQDGLSAVDLSVGQLLGSGWQSGAASAYSGVWDNWHNGAGQVIRGLQSMSESLKSSADNYRATDQQGAGAVGSSFQPGSGSPAGATAVSPTSSAQTATAAGNSTDGTGDLAAMMGLGDPAAQISGQAAEGAAQAAGQLAGGLTQAASAIAQGVMGIVQAAQSQSGAAPPPSEPGGATGVEHSVALDEQNRDDDERDGNDGEEADREGDEQDGHDGAAAADSSGLSAPAEMTPAPRTGNPMRFGRLNDAQ